MRVTFQGRFFRSSLQWGGVIIFVILLAVWAGQRSGRFDLSFLQGVDGQRAAPAGRVISFFCINCSASETGYDWAEANQAVSQGDCKRVSNGFLGASRFSELFSGCMAYVEEQRLQRVAHSAAQGIVTAQFDLGEIYAKGQGVDQNYQLAAHWHQLAAVQGNADAQLKLGSLYANGNGVTRNDSTAYMWIRVSSFFMTDERKKKHAMQFLEHIKARMTPVQIAQAHIMANRCLETNFRLCQIIRK